MDTKTSTFDTYTHAFYSLRFIQSYYQVNDYFFFK